jgi:dolichol-phosphate mannosyltransferase
MRGIIISPTYNEVSGIGQHLEEIFKNTSQLDVLIVDDDSPDGTSRVVTSYVENNPRIFLLNNGKKAGLGGAYLAGFTWCMERDYDFIIQMDADGSHPYETLPILVEQIESRSLVIGSRYVTGGKLENWPLSRQLISKFGNILARKVVKIPVLDVTGGYKAIRVEQLRKLKFESLKVQGYAFQIDLLRNLSDEKLDFLEIPITFTERRSGKSKMSMIIIAEAMKMIIFWLLHDFKNRKVLNL